MDMEDKRPSQHLSDDDLLEMLYGIKPQNDHQNTCTECCARWEKLQIKHAQVRLGGNLAPQEMLRKQRQAIYDRLDSKPRRFSMRLVPSLAVVLILCAFLITFQSTKETTETSDAEEVFEEVFSAASSTESSAFEPVQFLFEEQQ